LKTISKYLPYETKRRKKKKPSKIKTLIGKGRGMATYETRGVIVTKGLRISERFEQRIGLENYMLYVLYTLTVTRHC